ncbi:MAG: hypothetical protein ACI4A8_08225 [Muribaculaceae bacterium]
MATKQTINVGDKIYAILSKNGEILAKVEHSDFNDIFSIIRQLQSKVKSGAGLVEFFIYNFSQRWRTSRMLYIAPTSADTATKHDNQISHFNFSIS